MKISRNILVLSCFIITFVILMIVAAVAGTFFEPSPVKTLLIAAYFAGWVALLAFCVCTFLLPKVQAAGGVSAMLLAAQKRKESQKKPVFPHPTEEIPKRSPYSDLPVRERIAAYVMERRREEGIPAPTPLRQSSTEERSFSPAFAPTSADASLTSSVNETETSSEFDGVLDFALIPDSGIKTKSEKNAYEHPKFDEYLNIHIINGEDATGADNLDSVADVKDRDLDEASDHPSHEPHEVLEFNSMDNEALPLSDDDFEDIGEIIDLEPDDIGVISRKVL